MTVASPSGAPPHPDLAKDDTPHMRTTPLALLAAGTLLVGGCSTPELTATDGGTVAPATAAGTTSGSTTGSGKPTTGSTTATPKPTTSTPKPAPTTPFPTRYITVGRTITDTGLGHRIVVSRILRTLPWPAGYQATSQAFELVAVELTFTPSTTYTAPLRVRDLSITTSSKLPSRPDTIDNAMLRTAKLPLLPAEVASGKSAKGWVVFRVDPKGAPKMTLTYTRPASEVTDTGQVFTSKVFTTDLVG